MKENAHSFGSITDVFKRYRKDVSRPLIMCSLLATAAAFFALLPIVALWMAIVSLIDGSNSIGHCLAFTLLALIGVIGRALCISAAMSKSHIVAFGAVYSLRKDIAEHLGQLPLGWFQHRTTGQTRSLIIDEPDRLEQIIAHAIPESVSGFVSWLVISIALFAVDWRMALASIAMTPIALVIMAIAVSRGNAMMSHIRDKSGKMHSAIGEFLIAMPAMKVFGQDKSTQERASVAVRDVAKAQIYFVQKFMLFGGTFNSLILANICIIVPVGLYLMSQDTLDLHVFLFFVVLGSNYSQPFLTMINQLGQLSQVSAALKNVNSVLQTPIQFADGEATLPAQGGLAFEKVSFSYDNTNTVLQDVSFTVEAGEFVALVGPSGSGKSTIAALIPRLYDVPDGRITLGDIDIKEVPINELLQHISFVFQDTFLFSTSIAENLRYGKPNASLIEIQAAAKAAQAHDFIQALPQGYDTVIGHGGIRLSGGERQRIAIARAMIKDAPVVVLDEATAFTDPDNELEIQKALSALLKGKTVIAIAHRLNTITKADMIVVMNDGRIDDTGTHTELLNRDGLYARLWESFNETQSLSLHDAMQQF